MTSDLELIANRAIAALDGGGAETIEGAVLAVEPGAEEWPRQTWRRIAEMLDEKGYPGVGRHNGDYWREDGSPVHADL
jgi:hypothetical protein